MIHKLLFSITFFLAFTNAINAQEKTAKITFKSLTYDFGSIKEDGGVVSYSFEFDNTGKTPLIVQRVATTCSCTISEWAKEPVLPGAKSTIKVLYNPKGRPGSFNQIVTVYTNAVSATSVLQLTGKVLAREKTIEEIYNRPIGDLRFKNNHLSFNRVLINKIVVDTLDFINIAKEPVKTGVNLLGLNHLTAKFVPEIVEPNEKGYLIITFDASKKNDWGFIIDRFYLTKDEKNIPNGLISVSASIEEDYSTLSDEELAKAPKIEFEKVDYNFDKVAEGKDVQFDFVFKNSGKSNLVINKIKPGCGCTTINPSENVIKPGGTSSVKATFRTNGYSGRVSKSITVISNDPKTPTVVLRIGGIVEKPEIKN